jgi:aldehyde:ferredoxin oxidoreductase
MSLVRIDMSSGRISTEPFPQPSEVKMPLGGRAAVDYLLTLFGSPAAHPFSEESQLIIAPGFFGGTAIPSSGRLSIGGKSPLTGGIKEANVGGPAGNGLMRLGIQAIMITGRSEEWKVLRVDSRGVFLEPAQDIVGMDNYAACDRLRGRYGKRVSILIAGPAGERRYLNSTIGATDADGRPCRHAARGGLGAVMGSRLLKAVVIDDAGTSLRKPFDQAAFRAAVEAVLETLKSGPHGTSGDFLQRFGTPGIVDIDNQRGSLPTFNYRRGSFEHSPMINAEKFIELNADRGGSMGHACMPGCVIKCHNVYHDSKGEYLTGSLEFETLALLGSNLGIADLDAIARMDRTCDGLGIDTIETGSTIGILNDVGLFEFGDAARAEALIDEMARATPLGRILGSGVEVTAKVFGIDRVPSVKGQAIPGHEPRALKGWGVTYATSPQGADHTTGPVIEDPLSPSGQVERSKHSQIRNTAFDATGLCYFTFLARNPEIIMPLINSFFDLNLVLEDLMDLGRWMLRTERGFNRKAGIGPGADRLPEWMRKEALPPTNAVFDVPQSEMDEMAAI